MSTKSACSLPFLRHALLCWRRRACPRC